MRFRFVVDLFHNLPTHKYIQMFTSAVLLKMGTLGRGGRYATCKLFQASGKPRAVHILYLFPSAVVLFFCCSFLHMCVTVQSITKKLSLKQIKLFVKHCRNAFIVRETERNKKRNWNTKFCFISFSILQCYGTRHLVFEKLWKGEFAVDIAYCMK